jgi:adenylate cyclase
MTIWSNEIKDLEILNESVVGKFPLLEKELEQLINTQDANVIMLYSRRCLEVIVTDLCEYELKRPRKTEPLKGIIDKLNSEEKVPSHIITSMLGLNSLSTYGAHPKDFDPEQVKPALNNLTIVIKWYLKYRESHINETQKPDRSASELSDNKGIKTETHKFKKKQKSIIITIAFIVLAGVVITIIYFATKGSNNYANLEKSIAVLPFRNDSSDDSTRYFMDGVMEELLTNLQTIKDLRVISRTSVEQYRNQNKPIPEIAQELDVNYIVEGSGQKSGNSLRLRVQLIRAKKESHIWAKSFNSESLNMAEYFSAQSQFAEAIATELNAAITPIEKEMIQRMPTKNLDAYEAYLKGQFYWRKLTSTDFETSMKYFELSKSIDPNFALAYAGISDVWIGRQQLGLAPPEEAGQKAAEAAMKALELDSTRAEVHYTLAMMYTWGMFDWESGERAFKKAIYLKPAYPEARAFYSHLLNFLGRKQEGNEHGLLATRLDPANPLVISLYAVDLLMSRQFETAIKTADAALKMDPTAGVALFARASGLYHLGKLEEAFNAFKLCYNTAYKDFPHHFDQNYLEGSFSQLMKLEADAYSEMSKKAYFSANDIAQLYMMAGDKSKAIDMLEKAFEERDPNIPYLLLPMWDGLRDDQRFQDIAKKLNVPYR